MKMRDKESGRQRMRGSEAEPFVSIEETEIPAYGEVGDQASGGRPPSDDVMERLRRLAPGMRVTEVAISSLSSEKMEPLLDLATSAKRPGTRPTAEEAAAPRKNRNRDSTSPNSSPRKPVDVRFVKLEPEGQSPVDRAVEGRYAAIIGKRVVVTDSGE